MFELEWLPGPVNDLAGIWLGSKDRDAVTRASHQIDLLLQENPLDVGESRDGGRRILIEPPLGILYRVDVKKKMVHVLHVWEFRRRQR